MTLYTSREVDQRVFEPEDQNNGVEARGLARWCPERSAFWLNNTAGGRHMPNLVGAGYRVLLEHVREEDDLLDTIRFLRGKPWFTPQMLFDFLAEYDRAMEMI